MSSSHGLLNTVFSSCSSPVSKGLSKRRLRATRSLDPAIIRHYGSEEAPTPDPEGFRACGRSVLPPPSPSSPYTPVETTSSTWSHFQFEEDWRGVRRSAGWEGPLVARSPSVSPTGHFFSPRKWLQKKVQQATCHAYVVWKSEGDFTWNSLSGRSVRLKPVAIQSLSELERVRLQEVAYNRLHQDYDLGCQITIPKDGQKRKKSLRRKLDSLAKEKNKDKENTPQAFAISLSQVIANDRTHRQRQEGQRLDPVSREEHKDSSDLVSSILQFATKRATKELSSSNSSLSSTSETANESTSPNTPEAAPRARRRGGMSVDSITDLDDNQSRLLEALQLSLPAETPSKKEKHRDKRLSLNPIYRQVPRMVDSCCQHLEKYGLQTVGIFRVGSSKKRVRQLREEFDRGVDVQLDEEHSVHDVAALLKEFLRDMPDPLLTKELYTAFINTMLMEPEDQQIATQLLVYLLPPCNSDTLHRLLEFLNTVAQHAHDAIDKDGHEVTGNKMTSINLATIFGPNLLHKQKSSDKEFSVQSSARAEESTAVIAVVQRMIATFEDLFMVSPDLQNEVLMSLLETDPDVVDYLLRRKASQSSDLLNSETSFSLSERRSSSDSNKVSSGEVSPYDNNSPVMSERRGGDGGSTGTVPGGALSTERLFRVPEQYTLVGQVTGRTRDTVSSPWSPSKDISEEHANIWGAWHTTLKPGLKEQNYTGSYTNMSEGSSRSSQEGIDSHHSSDPKQLVRTQPSLGVTDCRQHPAATRVGSSPHSGQRQLRLNLNPDGQSASSSSEDLPVGSSHSTPSPTVFPKPANRNDARPPPPPYGLSRPATSTFSSISPTSLAPVSSAQQCPQQGTGKTVAQNSSSSPGGALTPLSPEWQDWQRDRWQIWQLLSSDNADTLPETLV
ncbi:rho GTPase-activating protein 6 isoform X1 [Astyanax mexicanus]|uniref:Rho GTPase-activating protein 6 isoform X1 n=1 Tax=Astyanax mexicanus TaxID=7994 RepID=A0A8T2KUM9_ASTMX|nr:rho GTPase-activating protein 6 isoform X1 [Astyanax mexicanus]